jgi:hypothetical protein
MKQIYFEDLINNQSVKNKWKTVTAFVEANGFEHSRLWSELEKQISWKEASSCPWLTVGVLDDRPVNVLFRFDVLNGQTVCFWEPTSQVVDYLLIEDFLKYVGKYCLPDVITTNATNFHQVIQKIKK